MEEQRKVQGEEGRGGQEVHLRGDDRKCVVRGEGVLEEVQEEKQRKLTVHSSKGSATACNGIHLNLLAHLYIPSEYLLGSTAKKKEQNIRR